MNEIVQQIKFLKSRLNQDVDISLLGDGESGYALNVVPEDSEHAGARTNCLGTTQKTVYIPNVSSTSLTVTETVISSVLSTFDITLGSIPDIFEFEYVANFRLNSIYISSVGYSTLGLFKNFVITSIYKVIRDYLAGSSSTATGIQLSIHTADLSGLEIKARSMSTGTHPINMTIIGACHDALTNKTYYWANNPTDEAYMFVYDFYSDVIIRLPVDLFGLHNQVSSGVFVGEGKSRMIYWTYKDGYSHKINIYSCINHITTYTASYAIKPPPFKSITKTSSVSTTHNNFDKWFQVMVRNKFDDKEKSVFGSLSPLIYPNAYSENSIGVHGKTSARLHEIAISNDSHAEWLKYDYAVRMNEGNWSLAELVAATTGGYTKKILGNEQLTTLDDGEVAKLFDYVPIRAGSQALINNNRQVVADCTEGYANVALNVSMSWGHLDDDGPSGEPIPASFSGETSINGTTKRIYIRDTSTTYSHSITLLIRTNTDTYYVHLEDVYGMTTAAMVSYFVDYINNNIVDPAITTASAGTGYVQITHGAGYITSKCLYFKSYQKYRCSKSGARHYYGFGYYDEFGRCGGVNISETSAVDMPLYGINNQDDSVFGAAMVVTHTPPQWAYYYRIFYGGSDISWYQQYIVKQSEIQTDEFVTGIPVNNCVLEAASLNEAFNVSAYTFNKGDRIRILGYDTVAETVEGWGLRYNTRWTTFGANIVDCEILYQDESAIYINNPPTAINLGRYLLIEIYRPAPKPLEYYETEFWGTVKNPTTSTRYHNYPAACDIGTNVDQDAGQPMRCFIRGFDHVIYQTWTFYDNHATDAYNGTPVSSWVTSESFSNYFPSKTKGLGRVNFYLQDANQLRRNILRASNIYIPNSDINGLSTFDYDAYQEVDEAYGNITTISLVGDVLKIVQPHKISSMYLGAEMGMDVSGNQILLRSDKLLTPPRYGATNFGSMHLESIVPHGSYLYGYDMVNSCVWRDSPGGTFAIDNGMRSYFKTKTRALIASGSFKAYGTYDYQNELYLLTFVDKTTPANNETIGFHEPSESWYSFYSFIPEAYCAIPGDHLISFKNGYLYKHDNATRNTFYGTAYDSNVWVVGNQYPDTPKKWNSLVVNSNAAWNAGDNTGIVVDSDAVEYTDPQNYTHHKGNMTSRLKEAQFRYNQGEYQAEFLRDATTRSTTFSQEDLRNGRPLIGRTILIKLKISLTSAVYLRGVRINAQST